MIRPGCYLNRCWRTRLKLREPIRFLQQLSTKISTRHVRSHDFVCRFPFKWARAAKSRLPGGGAGPSSSSPALRGRRYRAGTELRPHPPRGRVSLRGADRPDQLRSRGPAVVQVRRRGRKRRAEPPVKLLHRGNPVRRNDRNRGRGRGGAVLRSPACGRPVRRSILRRRAAGDPGWPPDRDAVCAGHDPETALQRRGRSAGGPGRDGHE